MNTNKEQYKKLFVLSPKHYEKLQKQQNKIAPDQPLDQMLFKILQYNQPNVYKKWLMYKNALIKFKESKDKNTLKIPQNKVEKNAKDITFATPHLSKLLRKEPTYYWDSDFYNQQTPVTTKPRKSVTFLKNFGESQNDLFNKYRTQDDISENDSLNSNTGGFLNTSIEHPVFDSTRNPQINELFNKSTPNRNLQEAELFDYNLNNSNSSSSSKDENEDVEQELFKLAKKSFGEPNEENIVRLDDTLNKNFRVFENRKTRDLVAIEVEPVKSFVENDMPLSLQQQEEPRTSVSPVVRNIDEYTSEERQPRFIRVGETALSSEGLPNENDTSRAKSIHLRNRTIKRRRSGSLSRVNYRTKNPVKKPRKIQQPQQGKGFKFNWKSFNQKKI